MTDGSDAIPQGREFEWDESKRRRNLSKHGIDFVDAIQVFLDPRRYIYGPRTGFTEPRFIAVGKASGRMIALVFTERGDAIRIISARAARRSEKRRYE